MANSDATTANTVPTSTYRVWVGGDGSAWTSTATTASGYADTYYDTWITTTPQVWDDACPADFKIIYKAPKVSRRLYEDTSIRKRRSLILSVTDEEERARQLLKSIISEVDYRKYLRDGFLTVLGQNSKNRYQIFPGTEMVKVFDYESKKFLPKKLCALIDEEVPPTDHLIMRKLLLEKNEDKFLQVAIRH